MDNYSERRLVENEVMFRAANRQVQRQVQQDHPRKRGEDTMILRFYCECSNLHCRDRIKLTVSQYQAATEGKKEFIVIPGHENMLVEKIVHQNEKYTVVEKFLDPAKVTAETN